MEAFRKHMKDTHAHSRTHTHTHTHTHRASVPQGWGNGRRRRRSLIHRLRSGTMSTFPCTTPCPWPARNCAPPVTRRPPWKIRADRAKEEQADAQLAEWDDANIPVHSTLPVTSPPWCPCGPPSRNRFCWAARAWEFWERIVVLIVHETCDSQMRHASVA